MQLKSIKLKNFRQFISTKIEFATGENGKNVTLIMGDNGAGKTTLAQAFSWCLYSESDFKDKIILNSKIAKEMSPNDVEEVKVEIELKHGDADYIIVRKQKYKKEYTDKVKDENTTIEVGIKDYDTGITNWKKTELQSEQEIQKILPKEMYRYFFFDGERINAMSDDLTQGKKSTDFAKAVRGLLGLNAMLSAIEHMKPSKTTSVIGSYDSQYDTKSDSKMKEYIDVINAKNTEIASYEQDLIDLDEQIELAQRTIKEKSEKLKAYEESAKYQKDKEKLLDDIRSLEKIKSSKFKTVVENFQDNVNSMLSLSLIERATEVLKDADFEGKYIPSITANTIDYLIKQGKCICGASLKEGSKECENLMELLKYIPPKSISSIIYEFKSSAKTRISGNATLLERLEESEKEISTLKDQITDKKDEVSAIDRVLSGSNVSSVVNQINEAIRTAEKIEKESRIKHEKIYAEKKTAETERCRADKERQALALLDDTNKKIEIYRTYANRIYEDLTKVYSEKETKIREQLQNEINEIFLKIFDGDFVLSIDENYHVNVSAKDYDKTIETSTAQSISVIFAFISGIIKMARDNKSDDDFDLNSEAYPLVMDAPLSAFDKKRIKAVCESLPTIAEQVIVFIKDTDGVIAEEYMSGKIGSRHEFEIKDKFETSVR